MAKTTKIVPREGKDGICFYVSDDAQEAYKILTSGTRINVHATPTTCENCKVRNNAKRKQRYLQFKHALGGDLNILASHAVHLAWIGPIPKGYVVDHLNGITTDNRAENLQAITPAESAQRQVCYAHQGDEDDLRQLSKEPSRDRARLREDDLEVPGLMDKKKGDKRKEAKENYKEKSPSPVRLCR